MKKLIGLVGFGLMVFAPLAGATEYPLQFTPNPGYRGLTVAGYSFDNNGTEVVGNCSYYTLSGSSGSGKGGGNHGSKTKNYLQTCRWDLYGNLLSVTPGAPAVPAPLHVNGTQVVFAVNANGDTTGTDLALSARGFVTTPGAHYTWLTPQHNGVLTYQMAYTLSVTLKSDGDVPLDITAVTPGALHGAVALKKTDCMDGAIAKGHTCSITVSYDDTRLTSPSGLLLDTLRIDLSSNAGASHDFIQNYTLIVAKH